MQRTLFENRRPGIQQLRQKKNRFSDFPSRPHYGRKSKVKILDLVFLPSKFFNRTNIRWFKGGLRSFSLFIYLIVN